MKPAEGVRLAKIVALQYNLELALAASPVRIEAPIPGKSLVGIEVPNIARTTLGMAPLLSDEQYTSSDKPLFVALGRSITGQAHFADLAKMPHMLVAGATGAGKSVAIHDFVVSLLYRCGPERLRFIMVDPKRVELTMYNSIPTYSRRSSLMQKKRSSPSSGSQKKWNGATTSWKQRGARYRLVPRERRKARA